MEGTILGKTRVIIKRETGDQVLYQRRHDTPKAAQGTTDSYEENATPLTNTL